MAKNPRTSAGFGLDPWVGKIPWRRKWQPSPVFWPGEFHGLYSPWGRKESDMTEWLSLSLGCQAPLSMGFPRQEYWSELSFPSPGDLPNPGIEPRTPTLQADSLPAEPQGKPKNIGVGSLSLLQQIFPTPESNWSLLHCLRILYQLSYQGIPGYSSWCHKRVRHHSN